MHAKLSATNDKCLLAMLLYFIFVLKRRQVRCEAMDQWGEDEHAGEGTK